MASLAVRRAKPGCSQIAFEVIHHIKCKSVRHSTAAQTISERCSDLGLSLQPYLWTQDLLENGRRHRQRCDQFVHYGISEPRT